jgi:uncharacterized protein (TIGR04255 family)
MSVRSGDFPRFGKPPVVETVLGVHFRTRERLTSAHQGLLWGRYFREQFPKLEEKPPVEELQERFGEERLIGGPPVRWQITDRPDSPRFWAASETGEHVIQIQRNGLLANWQKTAEEAVYRPFIKRREEFLQQLRSLEQFLREEGLGLLEPTSWVVTYISHVEYEGILNTGPTVAKIFTCWRNQTSDNWLPPPDKVVLDMTFPISGNAGRLHVTSTPVVRLKDKKEMLQLDLTARGQTKARDLTSAMEGIDLGHEWVVRGFVSLTRPEMHKVWERVQ